MRTYAVAVIFVGAATAVTAPAYANGYMSDSQAPESEDPGGTAVTAVIKSEANSREGLTLATALASNSCSNCLALAGSPEDESIVDSSEHRLSGGVDLMSDYMLDDAIRSTPGPVVQPWVSFDLGSGLFANAWGSKNLDPDNNFGNELDVGISFERSLGAGVTGRVVINHYVLFGNVPDMQEVTVGVEKNGVDLSVGYYPWSGGLEDGFRMGAAYNFKLTPRLSASVGVVYETGFEVKDTLVASAGLTYDLGHGFSAKVNGYMPHRDDGVHERRVVFGIGFSF